MSYQFKNNKVIIFKKKCNYSRSDNIGNVSTINVNITEANVL